MQVPFKAVWPPILLTAVDLLVAVPAWMLGWWPVVLLLVIGAVVLFFDMRGRGLDFRNAHRHLTLGRDPARVAKTYQYSWCGRVACRAAAIAAGPGHGEAVIDYYRANGYRWYHIFPDNTFTPNSPFLTLRFWQITLLGNSRARALLEEVPVVAQPVPAVAEAEPGQVRRAA